MFTFKNRSVYFSFVLGSVRFQQPHYNKKLQFGGIIEKRVRQIAYIASLDTLRHRPA